MKGELEIIYEDQDMVVVNKPPKLLSIPGRQYEEEKSVYSILAKKYAPLFIVHRLDKQTSGVLCFAKNAEAHKNLSLQFENRTTNKVYHALVDGNFPSDEGVIEQPIMTTGSGSKMKIGRNGKYALTEFRVLERFYAFTLVEAIIKTGRTHQIRVHFQGIGHPLAVDFKYGKRAELFLSQIKHKKYKLGKNQEERPLLSRVSLHSYRLTLNHPTSGEPMTFEAPYPKDIRATLRQLGKWGK